MDTGSRNAKVTVPLRLLLILSHLHLIFPLAKFGQKLNVEFSAVLNYSFMYSIFRAWNETTLVHPAFDLTSCKPLPKFISVFAAVNGRKLWRAESLQLALKSQYWKCRVFILQLLAFMLLDEFWHSGSNRDYLFLPVIHCNRRYIWGFLMFPIFA
jgi:hypothetical protein